MTLSKSKKLLTAALCALAAMLAATYFAGEMRAFEAGVSVSGMIANYAGEQFVYGAIPLFLVMLWLKDRYGGNRAVIAFLIGGAAIIPLVVLMIGVLIVGRAFSPDALSDRNVWLAAKAVVALDFFLIGAHVLAFRSRKPASSSDPQQA